MILCSCSGDFPDLTADDFQKHLNETLVEVKKNLPRTFVNLVQMGNISEVSERNTYNNVHMCGWSVLYPAIALCRSISCH